MFNSGLDSLESRTPAAAAAGASYLAGKESLDGSGMPDFGPASWEI